MSQRSIKSIGGGIICHNIFEQIISLENLFLSYQEFSKGKRNKLDIQQFKFNLEDNLFQIHQELKSKTYQHSDYTAFYIQDPKLRHIHKAEVRDRIIHHAVFRIIESVFDKGFIFDSYSCRKNKGTHKAINRLEIFIRKLSKNNHKNIYALKLDIKKFFDSIDQNILLGLIRRKIQDKNTIWLINQIVRSRREGLPLGNVTSQLFANIYLNELDQFIKHQLKIRYYFRYCDDFLILNENKNYLIRLIKPTNNFLKINLKLNLHSDKIIIRKHHQGIDFLGYVVLPYHRVLRTKTKKRIFKKINKKYQDLQNDLITEKSFNQILQPYFGVLGHCHGYKIKQKIVEEFL